MNLCACIITYYPEYDFLQKNINAYYNFVDRIVIWQNTPPKNRKNKEYALDDKIVYMGGDTNLGISQPLNEILNYCEQEGFSHLLMMDQDSLFKNFGFYYKQAISYFIHNDVAQIGPEVNNSKILKGEFKECKYVITSGSIIDVKKAISVGGFRKDFFVDGIDLDFGFKINKSGGRIYQVGGATLIQNFGNTCLKRGKKIISYSPNRLYNTVKSQIILWKEYPEYFHKFLFMKIYFILTPLNIIVYQSNKFEKLKAIIKGIIAGLKTKNV